MSQENLVENVEPVPIEDEKKETDDDHDKELELDPSNVTGNNLVLADNATDTIVRWLRIGTNSSRRQESVDELIRRLDEDGYQENLANAIIRYIMERPCDLVELSNRCLNVEAVMKRWPNSGTPVLNAINAVLSADQRLGTPRSPNLTRFITCCLEENAFDERDLLNNPTEQNGTSPVDDDATLLRTQINPNRRGAVTEIESPYGRRENVNQRETLLARCCRILSSLFCCNFQYI